MFADARAGHRAALAGVRAVADPLGRTIAGLVDTLNPRRVLLGGSFAPLLELARAGIEDALARFALEASRRSVELLAPRMYQSMWLAMSRTVHGVHSVAACQSSTSSPVSSAAKRQ